MLNILEFKSLAFRDPQTILSPGFTRLEPLERSERQGTEWDCLRKWVEGYEQKGEINDRTHLRLPIDHLLAQEADDVELREWWGIPVDLTRGIGEQEEYTVRKVTKIHAPINDRWHVSGQPLFFSRRAPH